jgi:hypothetical protein
MKALVAKLAKRSSDRDKTDVSAIIIEMMERAEQEFSKLDSDTL